MNFNIKYLHAKPNNTGFDYTDKVLSKKKIIYKGNCKTKCNKCNELFFINKKRLSCEVKIFSNKNSKQVFFLFSTLKHQNEVKKYRHH